MNLIRCLSFLVFCGFVCDLYAQTSYDVEPLWLNSSNNEIFAFPYRDGVIYSTDRRLNMLVNRVDTANRPLFNLFFVQMNGDEPRLLSRNIPVNAHQGTCTVSADGNEMFFSSNDGNGQHIYSARRSGSEWINIQPFSHNRASHTTTHPSLSRDGTRLFFASNMPGGYGGFDIYVSERTLRGWGPPVNLGPGINTPENEMYPFIAANGELYFSSAAHGSMGGLDIFSAREINGEWGFVNRLEEPVNSIGDDISFTAKGDGLSGYFSSNREGNTFNVYSFSSLFPVFPQCFEQEENDYTYIFYEGGIIPDSSNLTLMWDLGDGTVKYGEEVWHTYATTGQYEIFLCVIDSITNIITNHVARYELEVLDIEQPYITAVDSVAVGTSVSFDASKSFLPDIDIDEYYWMFGDGTNKIGVRVEHTYTAAGVYRVQLGVIGSSKSVGGEQIKITVCREIIVY